jgi:Fanconi anemia group M protein
MEKIIIDDREKKETQILAGIIYDNVEITRLSVGDALMRGVIFEFKHIDDFVQSIFSGHLFRQIADMTEHYQHAFLLIHGTFFDTRLMYHARSKRPNFHGIIASCIARGIIPLFTGSLDTSLELVDIISQKVTDGKIRDRPIKRVSLKDKQIGIVCSFPGISDTRARALLTHFGSINGILTASEKELCETPDIGPKTAQKIRRVLTNRTENCTENPEGFDQRV